MRGILSLGLLTKAYFLAFLPLLFAICMLRRNIRQFAAVIIVLLAVAGPWYGRNLLRYGTISAMQELREGVHPAEAISAIQPGKIVPVIDSYLRSALWTGNNSFRSFSINTLEAVVVLWLAGLLLWITHKRVRREWIIAGYVCLFTAGLGYDAAINFVASHGETISPAPWYTQVLLAPMLALGMLGASRMPRPGRLVAAAMSLLFAYIIVATYWVKLIPLYSGITSRTSLSALPGIYSHVSALLTTLGEVSPGPATVILVCACIVTALAAGLAADTVSRLLKKHV